MSENKAGKSWGNKTDNSSFHLFVEFFFVAWILRVRGNMRKKLKEEGILGCETQWEDWSLFFFFSFYYVNWAKLGSYSHKTLPNTRPQQIIFSRELAVHQLPCTPFRSSSHHSSLSCLRSSGRRKTVLCAHIGQLHNSERAAVQDLLRLTCRHVCQDNQPTTGLISCSLNLSFMSLLSSCRLSALNKFGFYTTNSCHVQTFKQVRVNVHNMH